MVDSFDKFFPKHASFLYLFFAFHIFLILSNALTLPSQPGSHPSLPTLNVTSKDLSLDVNLTWAPWPALPYRIQLTNEGANILMLRVERPLQKPEIDVLRIRNFVQEFGENIEREFPIPGYVPPVARLTSVDIQSYTKWVIEFKEVPLGQRMCTALALKALDETSRLLIRHGPASMNFIVEDTDYAYASGTLAIRKLGA